MREEVTIFSQTPNYTKKIRAYLPFYPFENSSYDSASNFRNWEWLIREPDFVKVERIIILNCWWLILWWLWLILWVVNGATYIFERECIVRGKSCDEVNSWEICFFFSFSNVRYLYKQHDWWKVVNGGKDHQNTSIALNLHTWKNVCNQSE